MPFDPSTAQLVNNDSSGGFDPSSAQLVSQPTQDQDEFSQIGPGPATSVDTVPIQARALSGLMRTPQGKADIINKIAPQMNAQVNSDGDVYANGKPLKLDPEDIGAFMYDLPGMISEATTNNIPLAANLAATAATGGMSLPAQMAIQGAAMGGGEGIKELLAQGLAQEKPSGIDIGMNTAFGAAGPILDKAFVMATGKGMKFLANNLSNFTGPAKDVGPEILNATAGIKLGVGDKVFEKMDNGEDLSKIITPENADGSKPSSILNNTFYGNQSASRTPENFIDTLKYNITNADPDKVDSIKKMYQDVWGISPQTIETVINNPTKDVINSSLFSPNAPLTVGAQFAQKLAEGDKSLESEYGNTLRTAIANGKTKQVNIGQALQEMFQSGDINKGGVGIFDNDAINPGYTGNAAKIVYSNLLKKLTENGSNITDEGSKILQDLLNKNPEGFTSTSKGFQTKLSADQVNRLTQGGYFKTLPADQAYRFLAEVKPLLNKTFQGESLSGAEKGPLAGFMKNIRGQLGDLSPDMKAMNQKYENYQSARTFFGDGKAGNLQDMLNINNKMAQAYSDPAIRTFLGRLDQTMGSKDLTNMVDHLGASQEMKAFFDKATGKSEDKLQSLITSIKGLADKTSNHAIQNMAMSGYDDLLPTNKKFLDPMWNHLISNEFQNKPLSIFKSKYIGLMALTAAGMGHAGVLPALGVGMTLSSPRNLSRGLMALQKIKGASGALPKNLKGIPSKAGQLANRITSDRVLHSLLKSAKQAQEATNNK